MHHQQILIFSLNVILSQFLVGNSINNRMFTFISTNTLNWIFALTFLLFKASLQVRALCHYSILNLKITVSSDSLVVALNFIIKFLCLSLMLTLDCDDTNMNSLSRQYALLGSYQQIKWDPTKLLINNQWSTNDWLSFWILWNISKN